MEKGIDRSGRRFVSFEAYGQVEKKRVKKYYSILDGLIELQKEENKVESELYDLMAIPTGDKLLKWSYLVKSTWWYKAFSKIDPRFNRIRKCS